MLIASILGILVGAVLGLTGAGGGILAVPALVMGMGWTIQQATPVALVAVAVSALIGAYAGWRRGMVHYRAGLLMALVGIPFTTIGVSIAHLFSQQWLTVFFATTLLLVAIRTWRKSHSGEPSNATIAQRNAAQINPLTGRFDWSSWKTTAVIAAIGATTGFFTGLLGIGGGFVIGAMLRRMSNASPHGIVATSLFVIALVSSGGVISALLHGAVMPWGTTTWFTAATAAGMLLARSLALKFSGHYLQKAFSILLVTVAALLLHRAF